MTKPTEPTARAPALTGTRVLLRGLAVLATLVLAGYLIDATGFGALLDKDWIDLHVRSRGIAGELTFLGIGALFTALGLPRQVVAFLGGYAYGFVVGTLIALAATVMGCAIAFAYARLFGRELIAHRFSGRIRRADAFLGENPFTATLLVRLLPVGSNLFTNLAAGVSSIGAASFLAGSALGHLPQTLVFALVGSGINVDPAFRLSLGIALFIASTLLGLRLYRTLRRNGGTMGNTA